MSDNSFPQTQSLPLWERPAIRQFAKFCIIGFSSLLIDAGISAALTYGAHLNPSLAKALSFLVAATNGFFWNSRWTFRGMGGDKLHQMYLKFLTVNGIGFVLNLTIFKTVLFLFTGKFFGQVKPLFLHFIVATLTAAVCVSVWNFLANKKWTFNA